MNKFNNPYKFGTQKHLVLNHLMSIGSISQVEAAEVYKIRRLASRINELRTDGWNIFGKMKQDALGQRYSRYRLIKPYRDFIPPFV